MVAVAAYASSLVESCRLLEGSAIQSESCLIERIAPQHVGQCRHERYAPAAFAKPFLQLAVLDLLLQRSAVLQRTGDFGLDPSTTTPEYVGSPTVQFYRCIE